MSQHIVVAKRYAKALFELAQERKIMLETEQQLRDVAELFHTNPVLYRVVISLNMNQQIKTDLLTAALQKYVADIVLQFILLLVVRKRINILDEIVAKYINFVAEALATMDAVVTSAYPLSKLEQEEVACKFEQKIGKKIRIHNVVDTSIIGGLRVCIGDHLYDGSLISKLERLNRSLQAQAVHL